MTLDLRSEQVPLADDFESIYEELYRRGWTDGLPIVPPTPARVERMIAGSGRQPAEEVVEIPPRRARATIEKLAVNAVMAGCRPEYFPVLLAMVEAIAEPVFNLYGIQCTTSPAAVLTVVNGPIRHALDINCGYGIFGPGWRANATIGRALRLVQLNIGGALPGEVTKSTHGQPGRYTMCIGEFEEKNPWEPLHVERGFQPGDSTVTVFTATQVLSMHDKENKTARGLLLKIAHSIDGIGSNHMGTELRGGESLLVLCPDHAMVIAREGLAKADLQRFLYEETRAVPLSRWPEEHQAVLLREPGKVRDGTISLHERPEDFMVIVAGGLGGYHSSWCAPWGKSWAVTKPIRW